MKLKFLTFFAGSLFLAFILQSVAAGRAAVGGQDRTGAPSSLGTCTGCHSNSASFSNVQIAFNAKDKSGTTVTSYVPGDTLTFEFTVTVGSGTPSGYGMQAVALKTGNTNAGTMLAALTSNTRVSTIANGRKFLEQNGKNVAGVFRGTWIAPIAGTGNVTIYGVGLAVNGNNGSTGDRMSSSTQFVLTEAITSSIENISEQKIDYTIFPMPNNGNFNLKNNGEAGELNISIFNLQGHQVYNKSVFVNSDSNEWLQVENLIPGIYAVQIQKGNDTQVLNMVVTH